MCCIRISKYKNTICSVHIYYLCVSGLTLMLYMKLVFSFLEKTVSSAFLISLTCSFCLGLTSHGISPFQDSMSFGATLVQSMFSQHYSIDFQGLASLTSLEDTIKHQILYASCSYKYFFSAMVSELLVLA